VKDDEKKVGGAEAKTVRVGAQLTTQRFSGAFVQIPKEKRVEEVPG